MRRSINTPAIALSTISTKVMPPPILPAIQKTDITSNTPKPNKPKPK